MAVFKLTNQAGAAIQGGRNRVEGLQKLNELDKSEALALLSGLKANLRGADGVPKHGVLKLRNSSKADMGMEFARMRGLDRWGSLDSTFRNTEQALKTLMLRAGLQEGDAKKLLDQYRSTNGQFRYKDAVGLITQATYIINREEPEAYAGKSIADALKNAGISFPPDTHKEATADRVNLEKGGNAGAFGRVFEGTIAGRSCMLKRLAAPVVIERGDDGALVRGREMDSNHLVHGKVPHVIGPNRYLISQTVEGTREKSFHVVTAGRGFKEFCRQVQNGIDLKMEGLVMDKAPGTRLKEADVHPEHLKGIAKGFTSVLMNASSHGMVFGDIKRENAFVEADSVTLIDTDGVLKRSKWASKAQDNPVMGRTFTYPAAAGATGLQQDLWSVGFTLLQVAHKDKVGALFDIGAPQNPPKAAPQQAPQRVNLEDHVDGSGARAPRPARLDKQQILGALEAVIGRPQAGSVEDFALLCIKTALSESNRSYTRRFTGDGTHLLDPVLAHPLLGSRDSFIRENLVKEDPLRALRAAQQGESQHKTQGLREEASARVLIEEAQPQPQLLMEETMALLRNRKSNASDISSDEDT